ncbi:ATP-dependent DNA helicase II subunit [Hyphodiscus hymeniophilus]|uniref:ATP-dependent DNA helicase II subunit 2 n=1 Tax=Hyphodiscus hymeniophilus TaxID=353542 RepID=A0A9P6VFT9_9HELO|nr:ATP-dependent DNA helicase II subunit [Hyphodiscus hymeniophilus]
MAAKEATVYIVDLGASTADCHSGRIESDLDFGMRYVWEKIAITLSNNRASDRVGVIGFRTDQTAHQLDAEEYPNISIIKPCESIKMSHLKELHRDIKPSETNDGDAVSAIVVAIDHIQQATALKDGKPGKYKRTIVLLTDGQGHMDPDGLDESGGIDFDDKEYGFKEEDKSEIKVFAEAIEYLSMPQVKPTRPYSCFQGKLSLGNWKEYEETALYIDVNRYFKTKQKKPESASTVVSRPTKGAMSGQSSSHTIGGDLEMDDAPAFNGDMAAVKNDRVYTVKAAEDDSTAENGKLTVDRDELAKGYAYGSSAVAISEAEQNIVKLETFAEFTIIGFIPWDKYERYLNMGESCITVADSTNDKARLALSSLIHSLHELESYAVARLCRPVRKGSEEGKDPEIILLAPIIDNEIEALVDVPLPFAEDVRLYKFPPLDRVITTSGAVVKTHRNLPNDDLVEAMSDYVDSMDLSKFGKNEYGKPTEYMPIEDTYSPVLHRINQAVRRRATHPEETNVGDPADVLIKYSHPPQDLVEKAASALDALKQAADVKQVPPKVKGKGKREAIKPLSDLKIDLLLNSRRREKISPDNSIAEFRQMLDHADGTDNAGLLRDAAKQMGDIIVELIQRHAVGTSAGTTEEQAVENMTVMRDAMIEYEEPELYNKFIRPLKRDLLSGKMGENRTRLWFKVKSAKLGLIDDGTSEKSPVSAEQAAEFLGSKAAELPTRSK